MKRVCFAALIAVTIVSSAFAAPLNVNNKITTVFYNEYADASNVEWKATKDFVKASFVYEGEKMEAFYDYAGNIMAISKAMKFDKLPKAAIKTISKKYQFPPYELIDCFQIEDAQGNKKFYVSMNYESKEKTILEITESGSVSIFKKEKL